MTYKKGSQNSQKKEKKKWKNFKNGKLLKGKTFSKTFTDWLQACCLLGLKRFKKLY